MPSEHALCSLCGEPMPPGEQMFKYHGYSSNCPKPSLPTLRAQLKIAVDALTYIENTSHGVYCDSNSDVIARNGLAEIEKLGEK